MNQAERVFDYMETYGSITSYDAFTELGVVSLPRRIVDLKKAGHAITATRIESTNRYGEKVHYNVYKLEGSI